MEMQDNSQDKLYYLILHCFSLYKVFFCACGFETNWAQRFFCLATLRFIRQYEEFAGGNIMFNRISSLVAALATTTTRNNNGKNNSIIM